MKKSLLSLVFLTVLFFSTSITFAKESTFQTNYLNSLEMNYFNAEEIDITSEFNSMYLHLFEQQDYDQIENVLATNNYYYSFTLKPVKTLEDLQITNPFATNTTKYTSQIFSFPFLFSNDVNYDGVVNSLDGGTFQIVYYGNYSYNPSIPFSATLVSTSINPYYIVDPSILSNPLVTYEINPFRIPNVTSLKNGMKFAGTAEPKIYDHRANKYVLGNSQGVVSFNYTDTYIPDTGIIQ